MLPDTHAHVCVSFLYWFSLFRVNSSSVLGLGVSQVFISLEKEERPRPNASGKSWPARAELDHSGRDSPTYRNRVYFCEGWFSQHLARAYSLPAILNHPPGSTTLAIKGFPNPGQSYTSGSLGRVACALGASRWPRGLCWHEETVRRSGTFPVTRDPPLQAQATCVQSHTPDPSKAAAFCPPPLSY